MTHCLTSKLANLSFNISLQPCGCLHKVPYLFTFVYDSDTIHSIEGKETLFYPDCDAGIEDSKIKMLELSAQSMKLTQ